MADIFCTIAILHKRRGENQEAIKAYSGALEIYQIQFNHLLKRPLLYYHPNPQVPKMEEINLELKILQMLQNMARVYVNSRSVDDAIYCHQEIVGTLIQKIHSHDDDDDDDENNNSIEDQQFANKQQLSETTTTTFASPTAVAINNLNNDDKNQKLKSNEQRNILFPLTEHERTRIMSTSLNALAQFHLYKQQHAQIDNTNNYNEEEDVTSQSSCNKGEEDAIFYFREALDNLQSFENPKSTTIYNSLSNNTNGASRIGEFKNDSTQLENSKTKNVIDLRLDIGNILMQLGALHKHRSEIDEAIECFQLAKETRMQLYDNEEEHEQIIVTLFQLAQCYELTNDPMEAMDYYKPVLNAKSKTLGVDHVDVANILNNMSNLLQREGVWESSLQLNGQALSIYRKYIDKLSIRLHNHRGSESLQHSHILQHLAGALQNRARIFVNMNQEDKSIAIYEEAIEIIKSLNGDQHQDIARAWSVLGDIHKFKRSFDEAHKYYLDSLELYEQLGCPSDDPRIVSIVASLNEIENVNTDSFGDEEEEGFKRTSQNHSQKELWSDDDSEEEGEDNNLFYISTETFRGTDGDSVSQITFKESDFLIKNNDVKEMPSPTISKSKKKRKKKSIIRKKWFSTSHVKSAVGKLAEITEEFLAGPNAQPVPPEEKKEFLPPMIEINVLNDDQEFEVSKISLETASPTTFDEDTPSGQGVEIHEIESVIKREKERNNNEEKEMEGNKSDDNMDDLLAQMNVVTCDMDDDRAAKPFHELLDCEKKCDTPKTMIESGKRSTKGSRTDLARSCSRSSSRNRSNSDNRKIMKCTDLLKKEKKRLGPNHLDVATVTFELAQLYSKCGENVRSIRYYIETLQIQMNILGKSDEVAQTLIALGDTHSEIGDLDKAMTYYLEARDIHIFLFGDDHPIAAQTLNCIGVIHRKNFQFDDAMDCHQRALAIQRAHLSENEHNPDVSQTLVEIGALYYEERNSLTKIRSRKDTYTNFIKSGMLGMIAFAHGERGEYKMAMKFYEENLQLMRNNGDNNSFSNIVSTLNCLGSLSVKTGRYEEAIDFHEEALNMLKSHFKTNTCDIHLTSINIGVVEYHAGNLSKALNIFENSLPKLRQVLGKDNPRVAKSIYHIGVVSKILGDYDNALIYLEPAFRIQRTILQMEHPDTLQTLTEIGKIHVIVGKIELALREFSEILECEKVIFGEKHPLVADTLYEMGSCYLKDGDSRTAMNLYEKCYDMRRQLLGFDHPDVATTLLKIGDIHSRNGKTEKALSIYDDVLRMQREFLGDSHYALAYSLRSKGNTHCILTQFTDALKCFCEAVSIASRSLGRYHDIVADIHISMGDVYVRKCEFLDAKNSYNKALSSYKTKKYSDDDRKVKKVLSAISKVNQQEELCV